MKKKETRDIHFIKQPHYPGGKEALSQFITNKLRYPKEALQNKVEGTVALRYDINHKGVVTDAKVLTSIGYGCDEEAVRLVKKLKFEVPNNRKKKILFHKNIQIHFRLPKKQEETTGQQAQQRGAGYQLQYHVSPSVKSTPKQDYKPENPQKGGYQYTITIQ